MTRSVTITNTSNWQHEDYAIIIDGVRRIIQPGESVITNPYSTAEVKIEPLEPEKAKPFRNRMGDQTLPESKVTWLYGKPVAS